MSVDFLGLAGGKVGASDGLEGNAGALSVPLVNTEAEGGLEGNFGGPLSAPVLEGNSGAFSAVGFSGS